MDDEASRRGVRKTYEHIAEHFSKTREYPWPEVRSFVEESPLDGRSEAGLALDVGCGNGRHTELLADVADRTLALDASRGLLTQARVRLADAAGSVALVQGDAATLPVADDAVDLAVYVATLHHLPTRADRRRSLEELSRVLASDGRALVSAWSTAHDRFEADADEGFDTTVDWTLPDDEVVPRFYHIYAPAEFEADLTASGLDVVEFELSSGNCYAVVRPEGKRP